MMIATGLILHNQFSATQRVSPGGNALPSGGHNVEIRYLSGGAEIRGHSDRLLRACQWPESGATSGFGAALEWRQNGARAMED